MATAFGFDAFGNNVLSNTTIPVGSLPTAVNPFNITNPSITDLLPTNTSVPASGVINATYDPYEELTAVATGVSSGKYLDMTWDPLGRLASVTQAPAGAKESYLYAPSGLRVARTDSADTTKNRAYAYTVSGLLLSEYVPKGTQSQQSLGAMPLAQLPKEPTDGYIGTPVAGAHVPQGLPIQFYGGSDNATSFSWTFGDGGTGTGSSPTHTYAATGTYTATLKTYCGTCSPLTYSCSQTFFVDPPSVPYISSFTASPASLTQGQSATLSWVVWQDDTLRVDPGVGVVSGTNSISVTPTATTPYLLTATNAFGSSFEEVTVTVAVTGVVPVVWNRDVVYLGGFAIAEIDAAGAVHELHSDHLGTPRLVTNGTGPVEGSQTYGPYGEWVGGWGYVPLTGYTGHVQTEPNGLIYMRGRFYSPAWHRFLNSDQGADSGQLNQFAYAGGSPMMRTDPSGMVVAPWSSYLSGTMDGTACPGGFVNDCLQNQSYADPYQQNTLGSGGGNTNGSGSNMAQTNMACGSSESAPQSGTYTAMPNPDGSNTYYVITSSGPFGAYSSMAEAQAAINTILNSSFTTVDVSGGEGRAQTSSSGWNPSVGAFGFAGAELDLAAGGGFHGGIHEYDSRHGSSSGLLSEGWAGGEGAAVGLGKVTMPGGLFDGFFGFIGGSISAGPLAGTQLGIVIGLDQGWVGIYWEGHLGSGTVGGGGYINYGGH